MNNLSENQEITIKTIPLSITENGQVNLPQEVLSSLQLNTDKSLILLQIGKLVLLVPRPPQVSSLADRFISIMNTSQVSLGDLLEGLQEERQAILEKSQHRD